MDRHRGTDMETENRSSILAIFSTKKSKLGTCSFFSTFQTSNSSFTFALCRHIQEHMDIPLDTSKMSEQELQFHYFKMHDADNNNKLDGCELIKSLIHWHGKSRRNVCFECFVLEMGTLLKMYLNRIDFLVVSVWLCLFVIAFDSIFDFFWFRCKNYSNTVSAELIEFRFVCENNPIFTPRRTFFS